MSYITSWSGGKDSCLACYNAMLSGYDIRYLVNFVSKEYGRVSFHGTENRLIQLQTEAVGTFLVQKETTRDGYEREFKQAVRNLIPLGIKGMIFGDIYMQQHKDWVERVCDEIGIEAVLPLWGRDTEDILSEFLGAGFQAVIIGAQSGIIDAGWIGRRVDRDFIEYLKNKNICPCGEKGEYHTLVTDGPIFDKAIEIVQARTIAMDSYWFLDTVEYKLV
ncbi:MAG: diphthine--ammonia ligase [Planctomycetes bacterium]|nr:diphthine--ammonia ligase [Planctomycetota bacterium]